MTTNDIRAHTLNRVRAYIIYTRLVNKSSARTSKKSCTDGFFSHEVA